MSMTINAPAPIMLAFYVAAAERRGVSAQALAGTIQTDILKEYIAQKEWCFPIDPAMRLVTDMVEWCTAEMPRWHPISISGYHIREAGSTAAQELAFTLKDGFTYVENALERGLDIDAFAPRLSFFFNAHIDFFEEIAKYRAARRIWAREMRDTYGARNPRSWLMRFHAQTAGVSLTAQQPLNNVVRTAVEALAAVLGGTQSLHTNSYDEALALPTEEAVRVALRTQQIIAHETGVTNTIDPLGGSYFVESLTDELEAQAYDYFAKIDELGGMVEAVKQGFPQREIADAAFVFQQEVDAGERTIVGVNAYTDGVEGQIRHAAHRPRARAQADRAPPGGPGGRATRARSTPRSPPSSRPPGIPTRTSCRCSSTPPAPTPPRGRSSRRSRRCSAPTQRRPSSREAEGRGQKQIPGLCRFCPLLLCRSASPYNPRPVPSQRKIRVVVAKPGLDGHDRGAKIIARALRDAGMEVIYTGLHQTPEQIVSTVIQEDADAVGLSILSGAHMTLVPKVVALLREQEAGDVVVTVGGTIPADDIPELKKLGVAEVFTPGASTQEIIDYIRDATSARA